MKIYSTHSLEGYTYITNNYPSEMRLFIKGEKKSTLKGLFLSSLYSCLEVILEGEKMLQVCTTVTDKLRFQL